MISNSINFKALAMSTGCAILLCGCSSFSIHDNKNADVKGIPFYVKTGYIKQTTTYTRSWIDVTLNYYVIKDGNKVADSARSAIFHIDKRAYDWVSLISALNSADAAAQGEADISARFGEAVQKFAQNLSTCSCMIKQKELENDSNPGISLPATSKLYETLETNTSEQQNVVDYSNVYYFNSTIPPFGTTTAHIELNSDGTISKADSTKSSEKLSEQIPLKELLIDKLGLAAAAGGGAPPAPIKGKPPTPPEKGYALTVSVESNGYKYTLTKNHGGVKGAPSNFAALTFADPNISVSRESFASPDNSSKDEKSKNAITIKGTVTLPDGK